MSLPPKMTGMPYYLDYRAAPFAWKPRHSRKAVRRDLHDSRTVSLKLSAALRRSRKLSPDRFS